MPAAMAAPLGSEKQSVDLSAQPGSGARPAAGSRIRRDPPPKPALRMSIAERDERHRKMMIAGVAAFAWALFVIILGVSSVWGGKPLSDYTVEAEL